MLRKFISLPSTPSRLLRTTTKLTSYRIMSTYDEVKPITAYEQNLPTKAFSQEGAGLDSEFPIKANHTQLECWDKDGKPHLREYTGCGKLDGKVALLTGADSGIARSAAIMMSREGITGLSIVYLPEEQKDADEVKAHIEGYEQSKGVKVNLIPADLSKPGDDEVKMILKKHIEAFGERVDILVNNAAQQVKCESIADIEMKTVERTFQINIIAMFAMVKHCLPYMKRGASIINTSSVTAYKGSGGFADYAATKGAIISYTRSLSVQLSPKGIRVNAVAPGPVYTPLQPTARDGSEMEDFGAGGPPLHNRTAMPAECGPAYVFLASAEANFIQGQVIHVNGGMLTP